MSLAVHYTDIKHVFVSLAVHYTDIKHVFVSLGVCYADKRYVLESRGVHYTEVSLFYCISLVVSPSLHENSQAQNGVHPGTKIIVESAVTHAVVHAI